MASKKELKARIKELEAELADCVEKVGTQYDHICELVAQLDAERAKAPAPVYPWPYTWDTGPMCAPPVGSWQMGDTGWYWEPGLRTTSG